MLPQSLPRAGRLALLLAAVLLLSVLPAQAEYRWNPFENMSEADMASFLLLLLLGAVVGLLGWPLLLGWLTHLVLRRLYPSEDVRLGWMLLWACLGQWALLLLTVLPFSDYLLLDEAVWLAPAGAAAWSYFRQRRRAEETGE